MRNVGLHHVEFTDLSQVSDKYLTWRNTQLAVRALQAGRKKLQPCGSPFVLGGFSPKNGLRSPILFLPGHWQFSNNRRLDETGWSLEEKGLTLTVALLFLENHLKDTPRLLGVCLYIELSFSQNSARPVGTNKPKPGKSEKQTGCYGGQFWSMRQPPCFKVPLGSALQNDFSKCPW